MRKLTQQEYYSQSFKQIGRFEDNPILQEIKKLEVGESILFTKEEWKPKTVPANMVNSAFHDGRRFNCRTLKDDSGWVVKRKN